MTAPSQSAGAGPDHDPADSQNPPQHEIERAVARLNEWFSLNRERVPPCLDWERLRWQRRLPVFSTVNTTALQGWKVEDLNRLFRVVHPEVRRADDDTEVRIELLVADKSLDGHLLNTGELMNAALEVFATGYLLGKLSPRLWWFWLHYPSFVMEIETYVNGIRLRLDAETPVVHDQYRVFEEFNVPLENGQQTAIGKGCFFVLEHAQPQGARSHWRFSVMRDNETLVGSQVLQPKPIYDQDELVAVIRKISPTAVTLSVLTSEGHPNSG
jgi:hypothetical protein